MAKMVHFSLMEGRLILSWSDFSKDQEGGAFWRLDFGNERHHPEKPEENRVVTSPPITPDIDLEDLLVLNVEDLLELLDLVQDVDLSALLDLENEVETATTGLVDETETATTGLDEEVAEPHTDDGEGVDDVTQVVEPPDDEGDTTPPFPPLEHLPRPDAGKDQDHDEPIITAFYPPPHADPYALYLTFPPAAPYSPPFAYPYAPFVHPDAVPLSYPHAPLFYPHAPLSYPHAPLFASPPADFIVDHHGFHLQVSGASDAQTIWQLASPSPSGLSYSRRRRREEQSDREHVAKRWRRSEEQY